MAYMAEERDYLTTVEVAEKLGLTAQTIRNWRGAEKGPPHHGITPRTVRYNRKAFNTWYTSVWRAGVGA